MSRIYIDEFNSGVFRQTIECNPGENLYEVLTRNGVKMQRAVCKGAGICRGCQVYIVEEGMECLSCRYEINLEDLHIVMEGNVAEQSILLTGESEIKIDHSSQLTAADKKMLDASENVLGDNKKEPIDRKLNTSNLGIAFDIGTTTIASALVNLETATILSELGCMNRQAQYGADVISRIQFASGTNSNVSGLQTMHQLLCEDIGALLKGYERQGYHQSSIKRLVFSGNTTMLHFLMNHSVHGMTGYPFTPEFLDGRQLQQDGFDIVILPGKSAFVGGDIVSGIQYLKLGQSKEYQLLIDLGTNGELWLLNQEHGVCASTSCGPAFANSVAKGNAYGTSLMEELAKAYQTGKIDSNGLLQGEYFEKGISCGEILITQDSVRQIQLAKAAIRTGIELAAYELRLPLENISQVYLAGGFGFYLNLDDAFTLGLLPEEFQGKIQIVGNTSLFGAIQALCDGEVMLTLPKVLAESKVLDLSMSKNFQEFFLHRIPFPEVHRTCIPDY